MAACITSRDMFVCSVMATTRVLAESEVQSFHDSHVHGLRWRRDDFAFLLDLQYIAQWMPPDDGVGSFRFLVAEATLTFENAADVQVTMDWTRCGLDAQIDSLEVIAERRSPTGALSRHFEIEFSEPAAKISLWSTGFRLVLHHEPILARTTWLPLRDMAASLPDSEPGSGPTR